jgi:hypothetical protein
MEVSKLFSIVWELPPSKKETKSSTNPDSPMAGLVWKVRLSTTASNEAMLISYVFAVS